MLKFEFKLTEKQHNIIHLVAAAIIILLSIFLSISATHKETEYVTIETRDTIVVEKERLIQKTKIEYITQYDTAYIPSDTVFAGDTVFVEIPIEHKIYEDTLVTDTSRTELSIRYSGYKANLDRVGINTYYKRDVPIERKKSGFRQFVGIGVGGGISTGYDIMHRNYSYPSVGVGITLTYGWGFTWE